MKSTWIIAISCMAIVKSFCHEIDNLSFPDGFKFGAATAAFQIEGAWNSSVPLSPRPIIIDKGVSIWDWWTHNNPSYIADRSNVDVACNSYYKYKEDVQVVKKIGFDYYRYSISWPRVLPTGLANNISRDGVQYYKNLTNELLANGIEPVVTLYHFDHPQMLEDMGGWTNELMVDWFVDYARIIFEILGSSVKIFSTINEPQQLCVGYRDRDTMSPGKELLDVGMYLCLHNILKAHAKVYHMYDKEFRESQGGQIGFTSACNGFVLDNLGNADATETAFQFNCGFLPHAVYVGDYPPAVKTRIAMISKMQGYSKSRLPELSPEWISYIRGTADYFGLNHYTSRAYIHDPNDTFGKWTSDSGVKSIKDSTWTNGSAFWLKVVPKGFGNMLRKIKKEYNNPPVYVLENGYPDHGELKDCRRMNYFHSYLKELIIAIKRDGCRVLRYTIWSLLDNFELNSGYTQPFGIVSVDFNSPDMKRTLKSSAFWWKEVIRTFKLQDVPCE